MDSQESDIIDDGVLSRAEKRIWFASEISKGDALYNVALLLRMDGALDVAMLQRACDLLVARHESLRSRYVSDAAGVRRIVDSGSPMAFERVSLAGRRDALDILIAREAARPFDLAKGPLIRATLFALEPDCHALLLVMHHIISDAWSVVLLQNELGRLYDACRSGESSPLAPLRRQYRHYAAQQRHRLGSAEFPNHLDYWRGKLADAPDPLLRMEDRDPDEKAAGGRYDFQVSADLFAAIRSFAKQEGVTLFTVLMAAYQLLLSLWSGETDVLVGFSERGRSIGTERLIGLFVNTVALRIDLSGRPTAGDLVARVRDGLFEAAEHKSVPFEMIVETLRPSRSLDQQPLVRAMMNFLRHRAKSRWPQNLKVAAAEPILPPGAKFDLLLNWREYEAGTDDGGDHRLLGTIEYAGVFTEATIARVATYVQRILAQMASQPTAPIDQIDLLDDTEREKLLIRWNRTEAALPAQCLHELIAEQAWLAPHASAVCMGAESLSYGALDAAATAIARRLSAAGVRKGDRVGICMERSLHLATGLLAILKAGGAFVPLDPGYPPERLRVMLADSAPTAVVTMGAARSVLDVALSLMKGTVPPILDLDAESFEAAVEPLRSTSAPDDLAYVIYTSGSTGAPKGVMIEHRGAVNLYRYYAGKYIRPGDRILVASSHSFDLTIKNIFAPLLCGATAIFAPPGIFIGEALFAMARETRATLVNCSPSQAYWQSKNREHEPCPDLKFLILGGEPIRPERLPVALFHEGAPRLVNSYGPTEVTDVATDHEVVSLPVKGDPPIGRPIANTRIYLLGTGGLPVPIGFVAEIWIGGTGVARGYFGRPDLSAERFVPDPFALGGRIYRTGDIGRYRPNGEIEFLGRFDSQTKIRGFRIEPVEIEAALRGHDAICQAVVDVAQQPSGGTGLIAYYTCEDGTSLDPASLRSFLADKLPAYMVPSAYVRLSAIPLTPSLKLDRRALPSAAPFIAGKSPLEAPVGEEEAAVAAVWARILGLPRIGRHDNFFDLGGHSLLAVQALEEMRPLFDGELELRALFSNQTVAAFAAHLKAAKADPARTDDRGKWKSSVLVLSPENERDLFLFSPLGGWLRAYDELVALVGEYFQVHGAHAYAAETQGVTTIADFARIYAASVCERAAMGRPVLLGYSFGGFVATECARQVYAASGEAPLLAIIDLHPLDAKYRAYMLTAKAPKAVVDELVRRNLPNLPADALDGPVLEGAFVGPDLDLRRIVDILSAHNTIYARQFAEPSFIGLVDVYLRNFAALRKYRQEPYNGPAILYASNAQLARPDYAPRMLRLYPRATLVGVESGHMDIMNAAPIRQIAGDLLARADARLAAPAAVDR